MFDLFKRKQIKELKAHLKYMQKEIAESRCSPISSKELASIMADYFGGVVTIFRVVGTLTVMASSNNPETDEDQERQLDFEEEMERIFEDSGKNLKNMDQLLQTSVFLEKRKIFWKTLMTYNMDFGIVTIEKPSKKREFPEEIADEMCVYLKTYNVLQAHDRMLYFNNLIPSKERLIQMAKDNEGAVANATYWCMIQLHNLSDEKRGKCLKYLRTILPLDNLFYYSKDVLAVPYEGSEADLPDYLDDIINLLDDRCEQAAGIIAIPYHGDYVETLLVAECQLIDLDVFELRIIPDGNMQDYMPREKGKVIRCEQRPAIFEGDADSQSPSNCETISEDQESQMDIYEPPEETFETGAFETEEGNPVFEDLNVVFEEAAPSSEEMFENAEAMLAQDELESPDLDMPLEEEQGHSKLKKQTQKVKNKTDSETSKDQQESAQNEAPIPAHQNETGSPHTKSEEQKQPAKQEEMENPEHATSEKNKEEEKTDAEKSKPQNLEANPFW